MKSYLGDPQLKDRFLDELRWHEERDRFIQGTYQETDEDGEFRGCAVGCSINSLMRIDPSRDLEPSEHHLFTQYLGIPEALARLEDTLFEGMNVRDAQQWPVRFAEAIPVGVDLGGVARQFAAYLTTRNIGLMQDLDIPTELKTEALHALKAVLFVLADQRPDAELEELTYRAASMAAEVRYSLYQRVIDTSSYVDRAAHAIIQAAYRAVAENGDINRVVSYTGVADDALYRAGLEQTHEGFDGFTARAGYTEYAAALLEMLTEAGAA